VKNVQLPDKPSELIRLAIGDLVKCESDDRYRIKMTSWHFPVKGFCEVCLAGSVMANTLGCDIDRLLDPDDFDEGLTSKLNSLDWFRIGNINEALLELNIPLPEGLDDEWDVPSYSENPAAFKLEMLKLADDLQGIGL
jgi:hypothetical protein